jgi:hypothetical protein
MKSTANQIYTKHSGTAAVNRHRKEAGLAIFALILAGFLLPASLRCQTEPSALFEVQSTDKGFLPPRLTQAQREGIAAPATGLLVYNTTAGCLEINQGSPAAPDWRPMNCSGTLGSLHCAAATVSGSLTQGQAATGVAVAVPYSGGNGGTYGELTLSSAGVTGLTATLSGGSFAQGSGSLIFTISGIPATAGTATFALSLGGQSCSLAISVSAGAVGTLYCGSAALNEPLITSRPVSSAAAVVIPYSGGNGGPYNGQTTISTGVTGLSATLAPGNFAQGSGSLSLVLSGTPSVAGTAGFALDIGGQSCTLNLTVAPHPPGAISQLLCMQAAVSGTIYAGQATNGFTVSVPYTGGNGGPHNGQTVLSAGVPGLTATLGAGNFANGSDSLHYSVFGTPVSPGLASFVLDIGGETCTLEVSVFPPPPGAISTLDCDNASLSGTLIAGVPANGLSASVPYTGGNGGAHDGQTVNLSGMNLTAALPAGNFASGNGNLVYEITGTPPADGVAAFGLLIGGQSCMLELTVEPGAITSLHCANAVLNGTLTALQQAAGVSVEVPYSGGNGGLHTGQSVNSSGVTGLTATLLPANFSLGGGTLVYEITGITGASGTANFALNIGGQSCTLSVTVGGGAISSLQCANATMIGTLTVGQAAVGVLVEVPYTGGNGGPYDGQTLASTGVTGLTTGFPAGTFSNGNGSLILPVSGTPASAGTANFEMNIGGQSCTLALPVAEFNGSVSNLNCSSTTVGGMLTAGQEATGVVAYVPYDGGNGGPHNGQSVTSLGVPGLTATLPAGNFANGAGLLEYGMSGTPFAAGPAIFLLEIGGQSCELTLNVISPPPGFIGMLDCANATLDGLLIANQPAIGVVLNVPYSGGGSGTHFGDTSFSNGVQGLTATLPPGSFSSGSGSLAYDISGMPFSAGLAGFMLNIGGQSCVVEVEVD